MVIAIAEAPPSKIAWIDILFFKFGTTFPPHRCIVEFITGVPAGFSAAAFDAAAQSSKNLLKPRSLPPLAR